MYKISSKTCSTLMNTSSRRTSAASYSLTSQHSLCLLMQIMPQIKHAKIKLSTTKLAIERVCLMQLFLTWMNVTKSSIKETKITIKRQHCQAKGAFSPQLYVSTQNPVIIALKTRKSIIKKIVALISRILCSFSDVTSRAPTGSLPTAPTPELIFERIL